jgi:hypothetical protein
MLTVKSECLIKITQQANNNNNNNNQTFYSQVNWDMLEIKLYEPKNNNKEQNKREKEGKNKVR